VKRVLLWLLPIVDVFALNKILRYYRTLGAPVPLKHARLGLLERWVGYLPVGLVLSKLLGLLNAVVIILVVFAVFGPLEFFLMRRGVFPWRFFRRKNPRVLLRIFMLEGYNAVGYYLVGALMGTVL